MVDTSMIPEIGKLTEPVSKLIDSVSSAIGALYEPTRIRKRAKAEAETIIIKAEANGKASLIQWQANERIRTRELKRQDNINRIVATGIKQLPGEVSKDKVDEDWMAQFFNYCQDFSDEKVQLLWGKVLAGEVSKPGSYSLMTLNYLKMMSKTEAELVQRFRNFLFRDTDQFIFFRTENWEDIASSKGIFYFDLLSLQSHGLITFGEDLHVILKSGKKFSFFYGNDNFVIELQNGKSEQSIPALAVTDIGNELFSLCDFSPNGSFRKSVIELFISKGFKIDS